MKIALIPPTAHLEELASYRGNNYHMALAQRIIEDKDYSRFYEQKSLTANYVILDNGACELKESTSFEYLLKAMKKITPKVVVLPDKLGDVNSTIKLSKLFLNQIKLRYQKNIKFMGVVQGQTKKDWLECLRFFTENQNVDLIGISNTEAVFQTRGHIFSRIETLKFLLKNQLLPYKKKIHLLGLPDSGHWELFEMRQFNFIEGVDTSAPIVHGAYNVSINSKFPYKKIRQYLNPSTILNKTQLVTIKQNIDVLFDAAGYKL